MKFLPALAAAVLFAGSVTACSNSSEAQVTTNEIGKTQSVSDHYRVFDGDKFTIYCDGDVAIFENYIGSKTSGGAWAGSDPACKGDRAVILKNGRSVVNFNNGTDNLKLTLFCENGTVVYEYNGRHFGVSSDPRCK